MADRLLRRLPPLSNEWVLGFATAVLLDEGACGALEQTLRTGDLEVARLQLSDAVTALDLVNSKYFRFDAEGAMAELEPVLVRMTVGGPETQALGLGLCPSSTTRKLVVMATLRVSAPGLRLEIASLGKEAAIEPGKLMIFPSYCSAHLAGDVHGEATFATFHVYGHAFR